MKASEAICIDGEWLKSEIEIEELEQQGSPTNSRAARIRTLKEILRKSTALVPLLQHSFQAGMGASLKHRDWALAINYPSEREKSDYVNNLNIETQ